MLRFYRPNFRAGVVLVREPVAVEEGQEPTGEMATYKFTVKNQNQEFEFIDEDYVIGAYPVLFTRV